MLVFLRLWTAPQEVDMPQVGFCPVWQQQQICVSESKTCSGLFFLQTWSKGQAMLTKLEWQAPLKVTGQALRSYRIPKYSWVLHICHLDTVANVCSSVFAGKMLLSLVHEFLAWTNMPYALKVRQLLKHAFCTPRSGVILLCPSRQTHTLM